MSRSLFAVLLIILGPLLLLAEKINYGSALTLSADHFGEWLVLHSPYHPLLLVFPLVGLGILLMEWMSGDKRW